ncbi:MAG: uracil-DNA glycosylase [Candidatus Lariskella arthropodorum]
MRKLEWFNNIGADLFYNKTPQDQTKSQHIQDSSAAYSSMLKSAEELNKESNSMQEYGKAQQKIVNKVLEVGTISENRITSESRRIADKVSNIDELYDAIKKFEGCDLKRAAKNTVLGDGTISDILLVGEAPGAQEDLYGIPFCGQSGKLLDNILKSIGLSRRKNCYITNTVFWRPPGNRRPTPEEIAICRPFVERHIAFINPKLIILVGSTAVESLLNLKQSMKSLKSQYFDYTNCYLEKNIKTAIILHPSYLLRQPSEKKAMWFDVLKIKNELISKI